jgi:type IV pilus assembly protein PilC
VRYAVDAATLRVPVLGSLVTDLHANQVCTFLGAFVETGVALTTGLGLLGRIAGNSKIARALERVRDRVTEGDTMTRAFEAAAIFPPLVQRMVSIGEETGQLPAALRRARTFYDREIPRRVKKIFDLIGPITTVLLGIILLVVILAVLLPVYKMYTAFSTGR